MDEIAFKLLEIFKEKDIDKKNIPYIMSELSEKINFILWERVTLLPQTFYNLKDTIWYNLEHIVLGGEQKGMSDLRFMGKKYPNLISLCSDDLYLHEENVQPLLDELMTISKQWSNQWTFVQLITKSDDMWSSNEENPTPIVIYEPNVESPSKYGYKTNTSNGNSNLILNTRGESIQSKKLDVVHCCLETKLGTYGQEPLMRGLLDSLITTCNKAIKNKKGIYFDFENYNYF